MSVLEFTYLLYIEIMAFSIFSALFSIIDEAGPSLSWFSVFAGLDGTSEELDLNAGNTFAFAG